MTHYNPEGTIADTVDGLGAVTRYGYDGQGRLRARYYDPSTAQFLSVDPLVDRTRQPYVYSGDNPLNYSDLTGMSFWSALGAGLMIVGAVAAVDGAALGGIALAGGTAGLLTGGLMQAASGGLGRFEDMDWDPGDDEDGYRTPKSRDVQQKEADRAWKEIQRRAEKPLSAADREQWHHAITKKATITSASCKRDPICSVKVVGDVSSLAELAESLQELVGSRVADLGRTVNMAEVGFEKDDETYRLHVQCAFRVVRGDQILVGSADMSYPEDRKADPDVAYDTNATMYDRNARRLTARFEASEYRVLATRMSDTGSVVIEITNSVGFEFMPTCSGPIEAWRLFGMKSRVHYVYPDSADRD